VANGPDPMLSVEAALERLLAAVGVPLASEDVALDDAYGRILADPIRSALDLPPWDNSAMDGFAVHAADTIGATPAAAVRLGVVGEVRAGSSYDLEVPPGCAVRIATGAPIPNSVDAVVPVEATVVVESRGISGAESAASDRPRTSGFRAGETIPEACLLTAPVEPGAYIRRQGEEVRAGMPVLERGRRLGAAQIAMCAAVGLGSVAVHRRPVVSVLSTGDELHVAGQSLGRSGIPDANRPGLLAMCRGLGARVESLGIAGDSFESVLRTLQPAVERSDVVIVSGGVSVGPYDTVRPAFEALGQVELWRVAVQPGKPFAFGRSHPRERDGRRVLLFGLPGNPVSTLVTFELFVRPALERLCGVVAPTEYIDRAITEDELRKDVGRRGFMRVTVARDDHGSPVRDGRGLLRVRASGGQGSHMLSALAAADALAVVPEGVDRLEPGAEVEIRWLRT
jgi:molybdopterin molybdotransferase